MKLNKREPKIQYEDFDYIDEKVLKIRGVSEDMKYDFITPTDKYLNDPFLMKNMDLAVEIVQNAIIEDSKILVYGDPDTDGVTSTQQIYGYLKIFTENVGYVMNQREEGHGIKPEKVPDDIGLVIAVDSSTNSVDECKELSDRGIDVLVLDHHDVSEDNPYATIVNPQACDYPNKHLSGSAVCWQFLRAFDVVNGIHFANDFVDLACTGLVGDMMNMMEMENRYIVWAGLMNIDSRVGNTGLLTLFKSLNKSFKPTSQDISFYIAPCINAVIRLGDINLIMELFQEEDEDVCKIICKDIIDFNNNRKVLARETVEGLTDKINDDKIIIIDMTDSGFKRGMFGLIANEISQTHQRPCFFGEVHDGVFSGSARGFGEHIEFKKIIKESGLLIMAEGHENSFGVKFNIENIDKIKEYANEVFKDEYNERILSYDLEINYDDLSEGNLQLIDDISFICGQGFSRPSFLVRGVAIDSAKKIGKDENHTKISKEDFMNLDVMKFNTKESVDKYLECDYLDVVGNIGLNYFYHFGLKENIITRQILADEIMCQTIDI